MFALKSVWISIRRTLRSFFGKADKKEYLKKLVGNLERHKDEDVNLAFKICDIREKGFLVKVAGLFGYISFNHMPWKYGTPEAWQAVFPLISGKVFFCKIYQINKDPVSILINGEIPQFRKPELIENEVYTGVVIHKATYGAFIDIGYTFRWECGSIVGLLHKSNFENLDSFNKTSVGQVIETTFWKVNEKDQLVFGNRSDLRKCQTSENFDLIGAIPSRGNAAAKILKRSKGKEKKNAPEKDFGSAIECNAIGNLLDDKTIQKLKLLGK